MKAYRELTRAERQTEYAAVRAAYDNQKAQGLKLTMARGKPGRDQPACPRRRRSLPRFWAVRASRFLSAATPVSS